jgi:hypothetical protein
MLFWRSRRWLGAIAALTFLSAAAGVPRAEAQSARPSEKETVIVFQIGSPVYTVDGTEYKMDVAPRIDRESGRTLLPVRYAVEAMNASVFWNEEGRRIAVVHNETLRVVDLIVGEKGMRVSDSEDEYRDETLDQSPVIDHPGRTMLPIRAVAEALYGKVSYDPATQKITIVRPANRPETREPAPESISWGSILPQDHKNHDAHPEHVRTFAIVNRGEGALFVDAISFREGGAFTLCGKQYEPFALKPGESRQIQLCAVAERPGEYADELLFKSRVELQTDLLIKAIKLYVFILGCRVTINGGGLRPNTATTGAAPLGAAGIDAPVVNVGQHIQLQASASGFGPFTYQWTVTGAHLKDYQELTTAAWSTTPMAAADYTNASISYYWKEIGTQTVRVRVTNALGFTCSASRTFTVERNAGDPSRQPEDFYTWNHNSAVLVEHFNWHNANPYRPCASAGTVFHTFHRAYLSRFNSWRAEFGYPAIAQWDPATPLPGGIANFHASRAAAYNPLNNKIPTYLTAAGGALASPCFGARKKADFPSANAFWIEAEGPWHNAVHVAIGGAAGDMRFTSRAPKDPIFWRFHRYVDGL